jgi:hypothetical protein
MTNCTSTCENGLFWVQNITLKNIEVFTICLTPLEIECQRHESLKSGYLLTKYQETMDDYVHLSVTLIEPKIFF